ncbi:translation initiation factor 3 subunit M [Entomortierella parvispora]|uniref:Eukaryotic translation initiation factor 3 subunit M n=1 Tax=Entomortierella parvispora TaxID=205924 RepID=A0A9P3LW25_9FUNG|nr:translation initiation factor 3 subunit M [Entomortierella parvispora]
MDSIIFIDAPVGNQVAELATYISTLRGDEELALVKEVTPLAEANNISEATKVLVRESKTLLEAPEKEFEAAHNLLVAIVLIESDKAVLDQVLKSLVSEPTQKTNIKFKVLSNIFNTLPANSPLRLSVFTSIVDLAVASDDMDLVLPQLQYVPNWISEWGVGVDAERSLLLTLSDRLKESGNEYQSLEFLLKALNTYNGSSDLSSQKTNATRAIVESIALPNVLNFENLLKVDAIQNLKSEKVYELLSVFMSGNVQDYRGLVAKDAGLVKGLGLDEEETLRKIRLLSLASLGSENLTRELSYQEIAKALEVEESEVELWVIDVIRAGLVEAKLNQVSKVVIINRSIYRTFGTAQWQQLSQRLSSWKQSLADILQVIANAKLTTGAAVNTAVITNSSN